MAPIDDIPEGADKLWSSVLVLEIVRLRRILKYNLAFRKHTIADQPLYLSEEGDKSSLVQNLTTIVQSLMTIVQSLKMIVQSLQMIVLSLKIIVQSLKMIVQSLQMIVQSLMVTMQSLVLYISRVQSTNPDNRYGLECRKIVPAVETYRL